MANLWLAAALTLGGVLLPAAFALAAEFQAPDGAPPLVHWAFLESVDGKMGDMQRYAVENVAPEVKNEPGTFALYGGVDSSKPNSLCLLEIYQDENAYERHVGSAAFAKYRELRAPILKELVVTPVESIALEQKTSGFGTRLVIRRYEVDPERREEYCRLARAEAKRAVEREEKTLGVFVTAEEENPHIFRTLEVYADEEGLQARRDSKEWKAWRETVGDWESAVEEIDVKDAKVPLSVKGTILPDAR